MKVLYIASGTGMAGGATKSLIAMLLQARAHGIEFEVICNDSQGLSEWLHDKGIKTHVVRFRHVRLPFSRTLSDKIKWIPRLLHDSWINFRAVSAVKRIAADFAPDIIHENSSVINVGYHAARHIGVPDVVHIREYGDLDFRMTLPGRKKRLKSDNVFTISITKDIARHLEQDKSNKAVQIYDGIVQAEEFRFIEEKKNWFLYAGRIEKAKGIDDLLEAYLDYCRAVENPFPLYVCGGCNNPVFFEEMKEFVKNNGLDSKVIWVGERPDIADYMAQAAATIIPSKFEGLGRVMPEAMANGSLCVARYTGGTKEQLDNGMLFTGSPIAIAYDNNAQLTKALIDITKAIDKEDAFKPGSDFREMVERSQEAVNEFFSEKSFGDKIIDFYNRILSETTKGSSGLKPHSKDLRNT